MRRLLNPRRWQVAGAVAGSLVGLWLLLAIPGAEPFVAPAPERGRGFAWNQDTLWRSLETTYVHTGLAGCRAGMLRATAGRRGGMARRRSAHAGSHRQRRHRRDARRSGGDALSYPW